MPRPQDLQAQTAAQTFVDTTPIKQERKTPNGVKRGAAAADAADKARAIKRRASKACQSCRTRKVRCNVVEHGAPCTNCRLDEVECIITESRRKRLLSDRSNGPVLGQGRPYDPSKRNGMSHPNPHTSYSYTRTLDSIRVPDVKPRPDIPRRLPDYVKDLPKRIGPDEVILLAKKGCLTIPDKPLRNELLRCYVEFQHSYMPLIDIHEFLHIVETEDGQAGKISLLLMQAVLFAGSAFVDLKHLKKAGYSNRREARKTFYMKARVSHDKKS
ncbi:hypothetical protein MRB53_037182 [Persea americana]|nr:hypothetical protein MRB53_037182 [Persea americana]